eukprot:TRINITY_DN35192_c0_g1_i1.p4 TRINITY_DN35192_c0_g1~~TRINITY_DN35192_c0_g1_i1.p4  ORF type:complete len:102 (-),score=2.01 TRINITY_DN35192_c0_g1_i1:88-393(-)
MMIIIYNMVTINHELQCEYKYILHLDIKYVFAVFFLIVVNQGGQLLGFRMDRMDGVVQVHVGMYKKRIWQVYRINMLKLTYVWIDLVENQIFCKKVFQNHF